MNNQIYSKVFMWLFVGLALTFGTGFCVSTNAQMVAALSGGVWLVLFIVLLGISMFFSFRLQKMSKTTAMLCYLVFSFLNGLTFASIFLQYKLTSIMSVY